MSEFLLNKVAGPGKFFWEILNTFFTEDPRTTLPGNFKRKQKNRETEKEENKKWTIQIFLNWISNNNSTK